MRYFRITSWSWSFPSSIGGSGNPGGLNRPFQNVNISFSSEYHEGTVAYNLRGATPLQMWLAGVFFCVLRATLDCLPLTLLCAIWCGKNDTQASDTQGGRPPDSTTELVDCRGVHTGGRGFCQGYPTLSL